MPSFQEAIATGSKIISTTLKLKWFAATQTGCHLASHIYHVCMDLNNDTVRAITDHCPANLSSVINMMAVIDAGQDYTETLYNLFSTGAIRELEAKQLGYLALTTIVFGGGGLYALVNFGVSDTIMAAGNMASIANLSTKGSDIMLSYLKSNNANAVQNNLQRALIETEDKPSDYVAPITRTTPNTKEKEKSGDNDDDFVVENLSRDSLGSSASRTTYNRH